MATKLLADVLGLQPQEAGQLRDLGIALARPKLLERSRPDLDQGARQVGDEHGAVLGRGSVPRGALDAERAHLVVPGVLQVAISRDHLERPEPEEESAEERDREDAEDGDPDRHLGRDAIRLLDPRIPRQELGKASQRRSPPSPTVVSRREEPAARAGRPDMRGAGSARASAGERVRAAPTPRWSSRAGSGGRRSRARTATVARPTAMSGGCGDDLRRGRAPKRPDQ